MMRKYTNKLGGNLVLIVGGMSGIGFAVAEASVEHGANVVVASRSQQKVDNAVQRLREAYPDEAHRIRGYSCDLGSPQVESNVTNVLNFATNNGQVPLNHLVETAGEPHTSINLQNATQDAIFESTKTQFVGAIMLAKVAVKYFKRDSTSSFTMTGGAIVYKPQEGWSVRAAIGGAKDALTRGLAVDMKPIRVNLVSPGAVQTEMLRDATKEWGNPELVEQMLKSASLLENIGQPEDVAESYLAAMKNNFLTGTVSIV